MNKIEFNQEYNQLNKKFREKNPRKIKNIEYSSSIAVQDLISDDLIDSTSKIVTLGAGKEAFVFLAEKNGNPICVKAFRPYSATNLKRSKVQYHMTEHKMGSIIAKHEFNNLKILDYYGINVPKPLEFKGMNFTMQLLGLGTQAAPLLKDIHLGKQGFDPGDFLEEILDQIRLMFHSAAMVHGDLSEYNIILFNDKPFIIDVSQSRLFNVKTFTHTPVRIRIDKAIQVLERDLVKTLNHFESKYKIFFDLEEILQKLFKNLPEFTKKFGLLSERKMVKKRVGRAFFMDPDTKLSQKTLAKDRRIHRRMQLWDV